MEDWLNEQTSEPNDETIRQWTIGQMNRIVNRQNDRQIDDEQLEKWTD